MKPDRRKNWTYKGCKIVPVHCYCNWGQCGTPKDFGDGIYRTRYWRIDFPDKSWVHVATKQAVRDYVDVRKTAHPENFKPKRT
jgi:hypothetical protein